MFVLPLLGERACLFHDIVRTSSISVVEACVCLVSNVALSLIPGEGWAESSDLSLPAPRLHIMHMFREGSTELG